MRQIFSLIFYRFHSTFLIFPSGISKVVFLPQRGRAQVRQGRRCGDDDEADPRHAGVRLRPYRLPTLGKVKIGAIAIGAIGQRQTFFLN